MGSALDLDEVRFEEALKSGKPLLVDFWASWCGPCRMQGPIIEDLAQELGEKAIVAKVNTDEYGDLAERFGVQGIPTLIVFKDGKPVKTFVGVTPAPQLKAALA